MLELRRGCDQNALLRKLSQLNGKGPYEGKNVFWFFKTSYRGTFMGSKKNLSNAPS